MGSMNLGPTMYNNYVSYNYVFTLYKYVHVPMSKCTYITNKYINSYWIGKIKTIQNNKKGLFQGDTKSTPC